MSTLSPYLFPLVLDVLTEHNQDLESWCELFADDIVLVGELIEELNGMLKVRQTLETHDFYIAGVR